MNISGYKPDHQIYRQQLTHLDTAFGKCKGCCFAYSGGVEHAAIFTLDPSLESRLSTEQTFLHFDEVDNLALLVDCNLKIQILKPCRV